MRAALPGPVGGTVHGRVGIVLGWLAAGDYAAGQLERRAGAPDTDEPGEQSVAALTIRWEDGIFVSS